MRRRFPTLGVAKAQSQPWWPALKSARYIIFVLILVLLGLLFQDTGVGRMLILAYGAVAIVRNLASEQTFKLAIVALAYVPIASMLKNDSMAASFAEYAFLLLCIGVVSALIEEFKVRKVK